VLFYIALCPDSTANDIARAIGRTERQIWTIVKALRQRGMIHVSPNGRRHHFKVNFDAPFLHPTIDEMTLRSVMKDAVKQVAGDARVCEQRDLTPAGKAHCERRAKWLP
jgi:hypothetical protein